MKTAVDKVRSVDITKAYTALVGSAAPLHCLIYEKKNKIDELNQFLTILGLENVLLYSIRGGNKVDLVKHVQP